jgi:flagellar basal body-associated protein FliL
MGNIVMLTVILLLAGLVCFALFFKSIDFSKKSNAKSYDDSTVYLIDRSVRVPPVCIAETEKF